MTVSNYSKILEQLKTKRAKYNKFLKHNKPKEKKCGMDRYRCEICGRAGGHIKKYGLRLCRQCFREIALSMGFKKYN
ncbi:MAG: 30S ribosomal protein S14 [Candidatus Woesearchaeota archaeon]